MPFLEHPSVGEREASTGCVRERGSVIGRVVVGNDDFHPPRVGEVADVFDDEAGVAHGGDLPQGRATGDCLKFLRLGPRREHGRPSILDCRIQFPTAIRCWPSASAIATCTALWAQYRLATPARRGRPARAGTGCRRRRAARRSADTSRRPRRPPRRRAAPPARRRRPPRRSRRGPRPSMRGSGNSIDTNRSAARWAMLVVMFALLRKRPLCRYARNTDRANVGTKPP